jgi:DNA-binding SARP family transcriptional activator
VLEIKLLGSGEASYAGHALPGFPHQQPYLLLCYLLLNREQSQPREHLAAIFWGEYPTRASRKHLRNALWRVRHLLQSAGAPARKYLTIDDDNVSFAPTGGYWLDIEAFESVTARYQEVPGRDLTVEETAHLEKAVELYGGDLLSGIYEDWCLYERERLNLLYLNTLGKLATFHELNGTCERGLDYGRRILTYDNTREQVHRQMMRLYWQAGNRGAALAQYKLCNQILQETFDVSPLEETTHLYEQMKYGQFDSRLWARYEADHGPVRAETEDSMLLAEQILQRMHRLEATIEQASAELRQIEGQLVKVLSSLPARKPVQFHDDEGDE